MPRPHLALLLAVAASLGVSSLSSHLDPYFLDVAMGVGINVILAVSLNLVNGHTGQFSLGHAGFMAIGAYLSSAVTVLVAPALWGDVADSFWARNAIFALALAAGALAAAVAGLVIGLPSLRLRGDYLALVTLGFGEIIRVTFQNIPQFGGALGFIGMPPYTTVGWIYGCAALAVFCIGCLVSSTYGRGFLATHDDEIAAESVGIDTTRYKIVAFVTGALFAGVAGGLFAHFKMAIDPRGFDFTRSIEIVVMVILGGMGNTLGVIAAAVVLTVLPEVLRPVAEYRMILYSLILILLMLLRPQGLFGLRARRATP
jgi:branched-chain amino acid transport system permease protein